MAKTETKSEGSSDHFSNYQKDALTRPRDLAWSNWQKFEKVGDRAQGYIVDAFYRKADGMFKEQRGITLRQTDGTFINVGIKRLGFVLAHTDNLRIGDPLTVELTELIPSKTKGYNPTKQFAFYGKNLPENTGKTVSELELADMQLQKVTPAKEDDGPWEQPDLPAETA